MFDKVKTVAIVQSNYLPWKGYFDIIAASDVFVFLDNVQYTKNDWRNRNKIKTANGLQWLTVPCGSHLDRMVCEVNIGNSHWQRKHYASLCQAYSKAPYFERFHDFLQHVYLEQRWENLSQLNQFLITTIAKEYLAVQTTFVDNGCAKEAGCKNQRLIEILKSHDAQVYLSGAMANDYLDTELFKSEGLEVQWMDYTGYPEYSQLHGAFEHQVSILDLLFHCGESASKYLKHAKL